MEGGMKRNEMEWKGGKGGEWGGGDEKAPSECKCMRIFLTSLQYGPRSQGGNSILNTVRKYSA
jgi:hypothetical protein